jgi:hypothetical protein
MDDAAPGLEVRAFQLPGTPAAPAPLVLGVGFFNFSKYMRDQHAKLHADVLTECIDAMDAQRRPVSAGDIRQIRFVGLLLGPRLDCHHHNDWSLTPHFRVRGASRGQCVQLVRKRDDA